MRVSTVSASLLFAFASTSSAFPMNARNINAFPNIQGLLDSLSLKAGFAKIDFDVNPFIAPTSTDSRSPCPGLNSLANHGFIDRSGQNIDADTLKGFLGPVYGLSDAFSTALIDAGWLLCGNKTSDGNKAPINLQSFALHNKIEHDASLGHADIKPGQPFAPVESDPELVQDLISRSADGEFLQMADFAQVRVERENAASANGGGIDIGHVFTAQAEVAFLLSMFGDGQKVAVSRVQSLLGQSKLPEDYTGPTKVTGIPGTLVTVAQIAAQMAKVRLHL